MRLLTDIVLMGGQVKLTEAIMTVSLLMRMEVDCAIVSETTVMSKLKVSKILKSKYQNFSEQICPENLSTYIFVQTPY